MSVKGLQAKVTIFGFSSAVDLFPITITNVEKVAEIVKRMKENLLYQVKEKSRSLELNDLVFEEIELPDVFPNP